MARGKRLRQGAVFCAQFVSIAPPLENLHNYVGYRTMLMLVIVQCLCWLSYNAVLEDNGLVYLIL